jgi:hypothetical protein
MFFSLGERRAAMFDQKNKLNWRLFLPASMQNGGAIQGQKQEKTAESARNASRSAKKLWAEKAPGKGVALTRRGEAKSGLFFFFFFFF